jgi:hypothetical protein
VFSFKLGAKGGCSKRAYAWFRSMDPGRDLRIVSSTVNIVIVAVAVAVVVVVLPPST